MDLIYEELLGRKFEHGVTDCYSLLRDFFKMNLDLELTDYARPDDWWLDPKFNLYEDGFRKEGFYDLKLNDFSSVLPMDVFLISVPDPRNMSVHRINHCAIYIGDGQIIHHPYMKLSVKVPFKGGLKHLTVKTIRHESVQEEVKKEEPVDIVKFLSPEKRRKYEEAIRRAEEDQGSKR